MVRVVICKVGFSVLGDPGLVQFAEKVVTVVLLAVLVFFLIWVDDLERDALTLAKLDCLFLGFKPQVKLLQRIRATIPTWSENGRQDETNQTYGDNICGEHTNTNTHPSSGWSILFVGQS